MELLKSGPKTPSYIVKSSDEHLSHISRALLELQEKGLVECLTPKLTKNRIYKITDKGVDLLKKSNEVN